MVSIGLMIEGQSGLNWETWRRILTSAEQLGYQCVFRSDHYTDPQPPDQASLEAWVSLTYAATYTNRIEFGPLVSPVTFRQPAIVARMAAAVDDLSDGRLVLGLGAGWQEREHRAFGVPFYDVATRFVMLRDALEVTVQLLLSEKPVSYQGTHFSLDDALLLPRPQRAGGPPILIGGNGVRLTLPLAAEFADEWNGVYISPVTYRERNQTLNQLLRDFGRAPGEVRRSLMTRAVLARDDADWRRIQLESDQRGDELLSSGRIIAGTPSMIVDQIGAYVDAGVERFMLQWLDLDDIPGLELMAQKVLPHFHIEEEPRE
ncbi:MAG: TIGR03560 family F420-dependent LLM class oxidoreductase [Anaerolineae bacterium]|nr:TIGR03560 family F420-dependent LLM class oxidoreductase [Anaerolineae bacterium]NUQ03254.1 TIGR03560 family F420-dependent LLM class oxidoreductase [Anaerolineae bacterium]